MSDKEQTCLLRLPSGQQYQMQHRVFRWSQKDGDFYTDAVAYYALGSGEFFWRGESYTKKGYLTIIKDSPKLDCAAAASRHDNLELQDGEWVDFSAENGAIHVFHSNLKFPSLEKGWQYVAEHPEETSSWWEGKWIQVVSLMKELGYDFFRPLRLRQSSQTYYYNSLAGVTKVGSTWQVEIKGADEPNRALVVLDNDFKLVKVTRISTPKE